MWAALLCLLLAGLVVLRGLRSGVPFGDFLALAVVAAYARLMHGLRCDRPAPLPKKGAAIVVANHTCSADAAFLTCGCAPRVLSFLIAQEYYGNAWLDRLFRHIGCVPVRRDGCDIAAARAGLRRLCEGRVLCIFPEGGLSNAGRGRPRAGKVGVAWLALRSRVPVIPALVRQGPQTPRILRAWLWPSRARLTFGPAVDLSAYYDRPINRKLLEEVAALLMRRVAELASDSPGRSV